jgi:uncharacterized protein (DUF488 family)
MQKNIYTIGYEGAPIEALITRLKSAGVKVLIDVRAVPLSRKPGFSKNKLAAALETEDISYIGLKGLGTPAEGREAARKGNISKMRTIFETHLQTEAAIRDMGEAIKISQLQPCCLLCFEHHPQDCHRLCVAECITAQTKQKIEHLNPMADFLSI